LLNATGKAIAIEPWHKGQMMALGLIALAVLCRRVHVLLEPAAPNQLGFDTLLDMTMGLPHTPHAGLREAGRVLNWWWAAQFILLDVNPGFLLTRVVSEAR
jgi:hypothetical protein